MYGRKVSCPKYYSSISPTILYNAALKEAAKKRRDAVKRNRQMKENERINGRKKKSKHKESNSMNPKIDLTFEHFVNTIRH